jgi:DNA-binding response OmpR family regulator
VRSGGALLRCLVLSDNEARGQMIAKAASANGWEPILCPDLPAARRAMSVMFLQLAVVDLEGQDVADFEAVLQKLARTSGLLLVVCGNEHNVEEEIAARQLGAWLYLPGVVDGSNLSLLCSEARVITERRQQPVEQPHHQPRPAQGRTPMQPR